MSDEPFEISVAAATIAPGTRGMFLARLPARCLTRSTLERLKAAWAQGWADAGYDPPGLIITDELLQLVPIADAELRELGVMRITPASEEDT